MSKVFIKINILILFLFITNSMFASSFLLKNGNDTTFREVKDTAALSKLLTDMSKTIQTIESDFIQEKFLSVLTESITTKGHFTFKQKNQIRWEYTDPFSYIIIIKDGKMQIKDDDKVTNYDMSGNKSLSAINEKMSDIVQGKIIRNKNEFNTTYYENSSFYLVSLVPKLKGMKDYFNGIQIYFDKNDLTVSKIKMIELSGDYSIINFINKKKNTIVADEKFSIN
jgi:outer membrane lipoprotein-sorting protein